MVMFDRKRLAEICRRHDVRQLRVFGSASRGELRADSDVDLLVEFSSPTGFFELLRLEDELTAFFGRRVDLLTEPGLSSQLRQPILASASLIFDAVA
jgi:predicted nucleotidyltransferase